jgi:hypothetical protein
MNVEFVPQSDDTDVLLSTELCCPPGVGDTVVIPPRGGTEFRKGVEDKEFVVISRCWVTMPPTNTLGEGMGVICTVRPLSGKKA